MKNKKLSAGRLAVYIDFDNTITTCDVFDDMLARFAADDSWKVLEEKWQKGLIGSRDCLAGQIECIKVKKGDLRSYLAKIKLDPGFKDLIDFLKDKGIKPTILSDNFDYLLKAILRSKGVSGLEVYSNKVKFSGDRMIPHFPFADNKCPTCAHCKTKNLLAKTPKNSIIVYIGDGRSDICPSKHAHILFAKGELFERYQKQKNCFAYDNLREVQSHLKRSLE